MAIQPLVDLRMAGTDFDSTCRWLNENASRSARLIVESCDASPGRIEWLVRRVVPFRAREQAGADGRGVLMTVASNPVARMAQLVDSGMLSGQKGAVCLPTYGSRNPPCGLVARGDATGTDAAIDMLVVAGVGMRRLSLNWTRPACPGPRAAWARLATARVALAGPLSALGAYAEALRDQGLALVHLVSGVQDDAGRMELDDLANRLSADASLLALPCACGADALDGVLSTLAPDVVVCAEAEAPRRAIAADWCTRRLRVLVDVAPAAPQHRLARSVDLKVVSPGLPPGVDASDIDMPASPGQNVAGTSSDERLSAALEHALRLRMARAAADALRDLASGEQPDALRVQAWFDAGNRSVVVRSVRSAPAVDCDPAVAAHPTAALGRRPTALRTASPLGRPLRSPVLDEG